MNLPNPFNASAESDKSLSFISILLTENHLQSALAEISQKRVKILEKSALKEFKNENEGIIQADKSLQELGPDSEQVNKVVFGFEPGWIGKNGLIETKKPFVKKLTEGLGLQPAGFVVVSEAFMQFLATREPMLSAICLYFQIGKLHLFLLKQGKLYKKVSVGRSGEIVADLAEGLARLGKFAKEDSQYFPAKMLLVSSELDQKDIKAQQQKIIAHKWIDDYPFLQPPTVEILPQKTLIEAITNQGGKAVAHAKGISLIKLSQSSKSKENMKKPFTKKSETVSSKTEKVPKTAQPEVGGSVISSHSPTSFGVPIGAHKLPEIDKIHPKKTKSGSEETAWSNGADNKQHKKRKKTDLSHKKMIIMGVIIGLLTLIGIAYGSLFFISTAQVDIKLKTVTIAKDVNITLDPTAESSNPAKLILSASLVKKELSDSDTYETTGVKLVGEKAQGKITLFNKTDSVKTFESGTIFSKGDLNFTLDEEVKVASATTEAINGGETKNYGKAEARITASEIGADGNIGKDSELSVASFDSSSYTATTFEDLSGGSSREIRVVSEKDVATLLSDLTETLSEKAKSEFKEESGNGHYLVATGDVKQSSIDFDAEVGDEVETLSLDLTIISQAISYSSDDLKPLAKEVLQDELPEGYDLLDQNPGILSSPTDETSSSGKLVLTANLSAKAQPVVSADDWKNSLVGKPLNQVKSDLESKEEIESVKFKIWPIFSEFILKRLPKNTEKIVINVVIDDAKK